MNRLHLHNRRMRRMRPTTVMALGFLAIILTGAVLLALPVSARSGEATPFLDALFTATSATCVTGLIRVGTATHWSSFGQAVILLLIQIGGLGFMTLADVPADLLDGKSERIHHYHNAVYCWARAQVNERYQDYDATASGVKRGDELAEASGDLWRDARWAISRVQDAPHCTVELI